MKREEYSRSGDFLKELRKKRGETQEAVGEGLNISTRTLQNWEQHRTRPDANMAMSIFTYFGLSRVERVLGLAKIYGQEVDVDTVTSLLSAADASEK